MLMSGAYGVHHRCAWGGGECIGWILLVSEVRGESDGVQGRIVKLDCLECKRDEIFVHV